MFILLHAEEISQRSVELIDGNRFHCRNEGVAKHSAYNLGDNRLSQVMLVQSIIAIQQVGHLLQSEVFILAPFSRHKNRQAQNCSTYFLSGNNNYGSSRDFYYYYCTLELLQQDTAMMMEWGQPSQNKSWKAKCLAMDVRNLSLTPFPGLHNTLEIQFAKNQIKHNIKKNIDPVVLMVMC